MALSYKISPELNMILYVGEGFLRPADFFSLERAAFLKHPRTRGMITLVDLLEGSTYFDLDDIHRFIDNIAGMAKNGMEPGPYIMLTKDWGLHLLAHTADLMAGNVDLKARMYHTLHDAITTLELSEHEQEVVQLWEECKMESSKASGELENTKNLKQARENSVGTLDDD